MKKILAIWTIAACGVGLLMVDRAYANHAAGSVAAVDEVVFVDVNEDGNLDIVTPNRGFDNLAVLLGDGAGNFELLGHIATDTLPQDIELGDVNNDGHVDLLVANRWGWNAMIFLGEGNGSFNRVGQVNGGEIVAAQFVSINGDLLPDILTIDRGADHTLSYHVAAGDEQYENRIVIAEPNEPTAMEVIDYNEDGSFDIAVTDSASSQTGRIYFYTNDGTNTNFTVTQMLINRNPGDVISADMNNDDHLDLVICGPIVAGPLVNGFVTVLVNDGAGNFTEAEHEKLGVLSAIKGRAAIADFNEDTYLDVAVTHTVIVAGNEPLDQVHIFYGDGTGALELGNTFGTGREPHSAATADINEDGHADLAVSNRRSASISMWLGNGDGTFGPRRDVTTTNLCGFGDYDCSGAVDLADYQTLHENFDGPEQEIPCPFGADADFDIDMVEVAAFQNAFTGE